MSLRSPTGHRFEYAGAHGAGVDGIVDHGAHHVVLRKTDGYQVDVIHRAETSAADFPPGHLESAEGVGSHRGEAPAAQIVQGLDVVAPGAGEDDRAELGERRPALEIFEGEDACGAVA